MFNLGYKQIIINSGSVVTEDVGTTGDHVRVDIEGFGTFYAAPDAATGFIDGNEKAPQAATLGEYTYTVPTDLVIGQVLNVTVKIHSSRKLSEVYAYNYDTLIYQSAPLASADAAGVQAAMAAGQITVWSDDNDFLVWDDASLGVDFSAGYEGYDLLEIQFQEGDNAPQPKQTISNTLLTEDVAPTEGIGTGKQLEAEVRNATFDNIEPYGIQWGGNTAVDVRGLYHTLYWETFNDSEVEDASDMTTGWDGHEMSNAGGVNTSVSNAPRKYIAYVNAAIPAADAWDIIVQLTTSTPLTT